MFVLRFVTSVFSPRNGGERGNDRSRLIPGDSRPSTPSVQRVSFCACDGNDGKCKDSDSQCVAAYGLDERDAEHCRGPQEKDSVSFDAFGIKKVSPFLAWVKLLLHEKVYTSETNPRETAREYPTPAAVRKAARSWYERRGRRGRMNRSDSIQYGKEETHVDSFLLEMHPIITPDTVPVVNES